MERFAERKSLAGVLQPGDCTRYEMVVVEDWDCYNVIVLNDTFFDKLVFLKSMDSTIDLSFYHSERGEGTNLWTIKAAREMLERFLGTWKEVL